MSKTKSIILFLSIAVISIFAITVITKKNETSAAIGLVKFDKNNLKYDSTSDGLDCYVDEKYSRYFFKDDKLRMMHVNDNTLRVNEVTKEKVAEFSRNWLGEKFELSLPDDLVESVRYDEEVGYKYILSQKIQDKELNLINMSFTPEGELMGVNFKDDFYVTNENMGKLLDFTDDMAIDIVKDYVKNDSEKMKYFEYVFDDKTETSVNLACCREKVYKVVKFLYEKDGIEYGYFVYVDAFTHEIDFDDCYK